MAMIKRALCLGTEQDESRISDEDLHKSAGVDFEQEDLGKEEKEEE